jgi:hypothetical protein
MNYERLTGFEPATSNLASWRSDLLSYNRMEPSVRFERTTFSVPRRRSGRYSYEGVSWAPRLRTWKSLGSKPSGSAGSPSAHQEPPADAEPAP